MKIKFVILASFLILNAAVAAAAQQQYKGKFDGGLVAHSEDFERVVFKYAAPGERAKNLQSLSADAHTATGRLISPLDGTDEPTLSAILVEEKDKNPVILADINGDGAISDNEKFVFAPEQADNPYLWTATINLSATGGVFTNCPIFLRYFKNFKIGKMSDDDRLLTQSTEVFARGSVDVGGKKIAVQYSFDFGAGNVNAQRGWQGVDTDGDGAIDMGNFSPEAAKAAKGESVVFRVGQTYLSTEAADARKNEIVLRARDAKDYKRIELAVGREIPDFTFTDLTGKQRNFSEFRGKYVVLDFWGLWCPACREEIPYLREAYKRYKDRDFEIVGMNTDEFPPAQIKQTLDKNEILWTQARLQSIFDLINFGFRIESFPSTMLVAPNGKLLSLSRTGKDEPDLRGRDLLDTLDKILPKAKPALKTDESTKAN